MSKKCLLLIFLLLTVTMVFGKGKMPPYDVYEVFWENEPKQNRSTIAIWSFDKSGTSITVDNIDNLLDENSGDFNPENNELTGNKEEIKCKLSGNAKYSSKESRFGDRSVKLNGKGAVTSDQLDLGFYKRSEGCFSVNFWLKFNELDQNYNKTVLAVGKKSGFSVQFTKEKKLNLLFEDKLLLTNPRIINKKQWYYITFSWNGGKGGGLNLAVNGTLVNYPVGRKNQFTKWLRIAKGKLFIGADPSLKNGIIGYVDSVLIQKYNPRLYTLKDMPYIDPDKKLKQAPLKPPYFVTEPKVTAYISFDGTMKPDIYNNPLGFNYKTDKKAFVKGVKGQAVDLSKISNTNNLTLNGLYSVPFNKSNAFEFWFRPKNWHNHYKGGALGEGIEHSNLFKISSDPLFKRNAPPIKAFAFHHGRGFHNHNKPYIPFDPGGWVHVLLSFNGPKKGYTAYLNGVPQKFGQLGFGGPFHIFPRKALKEWMDKTGGKDDDTFKLKLSKTNTLLDEIKIYDKSFLPSEAKNLYASYFPDAKERMKSLPYITVDFDYIAYDWSMKEKLNLSIHCLPVNGIFPKTVDIDIKDAEGKVVHQEKNIALNEKNQAKLTINKAFPFGKYDVSIKSKDENGNILKEKDVVYNRVKPVWYKNNIGKERFVPKPWTPIVISGNTVEVIGRKYVLNDGGLPDQIITDGHNLLTSPLKITATINGKQEKFVPVGKLTFTEKADDLIRWQGKLEAKSAIINVETWMEFDGLMYFTLTVKPKTDSLKVTDLDVDVPMSSIYFTQLIANTGANKFRGSFDMRFIPKEKGCVWNSKDLKIPKGVSKGNFLANLWLGGDDYGLNFSAENDRGWTPDNETAAHELIREDNTVIYRMNVISLPVTISSKGRQFTFIMTPTPTKPEPENWRAWGRNKRGTPLAANDVIDTFVGFNLTDGPEASGGISFKVEPYSWEKAEEQAKNLQEKFGANNPRMMYIDYSWPKFGEQFKDWNHGLHAGTGRIAWTPEVEDYYVWIINEYIKRGLIEGIYIDDTSMGRNLSLASTAYIPEGSKDRRIGYNTMGFRRFLKRIYKQLEKQGKFPYILPHMTFCYEIPAFSFATSTVDAEARDTMMKPGRTVDTIDVWPIHMPRIMGSAKKWGFARNWKPGPNYYISTGGGAGGSQVDRWLHKQSRALHAYIIPHDFWYLWGYPTSTRYISDVFIKFGMDDPNLKFIPYYKLNGQFNIEAENKDKIISCIFLKPEKALVMISNLAKETQAVKVTFNPEKLFGKKCQITIKDVDVSLPSHKIDEILTEKEANVKLGSAGLGEEEITEESLMAEMTEQKSKSQQEKEDLEMKIEGNTADMKIRRHDFRIMEIRTID